MGVEQPPSASLLHISVANCWAGPGFWMLQSMRPAAPLAFTAANSREDRARAARCRARHGRHWAAEWLAEQGSSDWGRYLDSLQACADLSTHPTRTEGWW